MVPRKRKMGVVSALSFCKDRIHVFFLTYLLAYLLIYLLSCENGKVTEKSIDNSNKW